MCTNNVLNKIDSSSISNLISGIGFYDFSPIQLELETMTIKKIGCLLTMGELYKQFNKNLTIVTYNDSTRKPVYISHKSHPYLPCTTALRMSCNIPLIFDNFRHMGDYYIDGVFANNFPVDMTDIDSYTIGIDVDIKPLHICGDNLSSYQRVSNVLKMALFKSNNSRYNTRDNTEIVNIKLNDDKSTIIQSLRTPNVLDLFSIGYRQCEQVLPY